jgi:hypothetical protein
MFQPNFEYWNKYESWKKNQESIVIKEQKIMPKKIPQFPAIKVRDTYNQLYLLIIDIVKNNPKKITKQEMQFLLFNSPTEIKLATARINVGNAKETDEQYVSDCLEELNKIANKLNKKK